MRRIIGGVLYAMGALFAIEGISQFHYASLFDVLFYLAIGFAFICGGHSLLEKDREKTRGGISPERMSYYWDLERDIFNQCFDEETTIFNWDMWFKRRDEIIHTAPENVLMDIDSEFMYRGRLQIYRINAIINNWILSKTPFEPSAGIRKLQREIRDTEILLNLPSMYSFKMAKCDRINCPDEVERYCSLLSDILYGRKAASRKTFENIVQLGLRIA